MNRRLLLLLGLLIASICSLDASAQNALVIETRYGDTYTYELADKPWITFDQTDMRITAPNATMSFVRTDITKFYFEDVDLGIVAAKDSQRMSYIGGVVSVKGEGVVTLYDTSGRQIMSGKATDGEIVTFDLNNRPQGTYIVRCGKQSMKVRR